MFEIYSKPACGYCVKAKSLLENKGIPYVEKILDVGQDKIPGFEYYTKEELLDTFPGVTTLPQIVYIDESNPGAATIGGYTQYVGGFAQLSDFLAKEGI
jgi:glutaredoxin 3